MKIGAETYRSFGDCCFHTPLLKSISEKYKTQVDVATHKSCADAFINLPFIKNIIEIENHIDGINKFKEEQYDHTFWLTSSRYFPAHVPSSLLNVQIFLARELNVSLPDRRPIFIPTKAELDTVGPRRFDVAIESEFLSQQSWATPFDIDLILKTFRNQNILWCSKPEGPSGAHRFDTRRETILALKNVEHFFCVGSGIFCASLNGLSPINTYVLWTDGYYKYKKTMKSLKWDTSITWIEDRNHLISVLNKMRRGFGRS
jgi:hypothetical protein